MHQACQHQPREERLARACRAEHARRSLHELLHVNAHGMILFARVPDDEVALLARVAEDFRDVAFVRQKHLRVMRRHILDGQYARLIFESRVNSTAPIFILRRPQLRTDLQHQVRQHFEIRIQRLSMQRLRNMRREPSLHLLIREARVRRPEHNVRDDAVIIPLAALDDHKRPLLNLLRRNCEPHAKIFLQPPANQISDFCSLCFHKTLLATSKSRRDKMIIEISD